MLHPIVERLLAEAAVGYASPSRPTFATCHRHLRAAVAHENERRRAEGSPPLACPSCGTLVRRVRRLDAYVVRAARHGRASLARSWAEARS